LAERKTTQSILALIFAFIFWPVGLALAIKAKKVEGPNSINLAAFIISIIAIIGTVLVIIIVVVTLSIGIVPGQYHIM